MNKEQNWAMPEDSRNGDSSTGDAESSSGGLWNRIRRLFDENGDTSLRAQIEEAIDDHEDEQTGDRPPSARKGDLSATELTMLRNLLHFSEHDADDVAIPRGEIIAVPASATWDEMVGLFTEHGHSRLPVYRDQLDEVIGMMHMKDVFYVIATGQTPPADWSAMMRQPLFVPQARSALDVLAEMRTRRMHLAIVVDDYSGTDGIITIEDLVEEIIGDIEDEHDDAPVAMLVPNGIGIWDADARAELDDVAEALGDPRLAEESESVDTLGGLAFILAQQVPSPGAMLNHSSGWRIEVMDGDEKRVTRLRLHAPPAEAEQ